MPGYVDAFDLVVELQRAVEQHSYRLYAGMFTVPYGEDEAWHASVDAIGAARDRVIEAIRGAS